MNTITAFYNTPTNEGYTNRIQALELYESGYLFGGQWQSLLPVIALELGLNANARAGYY